MASERPWRILMGLIMPPALGGLFFACIILFHKLITSHFNFTWMRISEVLTDILTLIPASIFFIVFSFIFYGVQSLLYSLLMEFAVQKIRNDKLVIVISIFLGVFVVRFLGLGGIIGKGVSADIASIVMVIGGVVGLIVGYYLRKQFKLKTS